MNSRQVLGGVTKCFNGALWVVAAAIQRGRCRRIADLEKLISCRVTDVSQIIWWFKRPVLAVPASIPP